MIFHPSQIRTHKFGNFSSRLPSNPTSHFQENKPNYVIKHEAAKNKEEQNIQKINKKKSQKNWNSTERYT